MKARLPPFEMPLEWPTVHRILVALTVLGFGMAALGLVGEFLGWWNDVGEILLSVGTVLGVLAGIVDLFGGASQRTLTRVGEEVGEVHEAVSDNGDTLDSLDQKADLQLEKLDKLDELDQIQFELDKQTGVLEDIRDLM